MNYDNLNRPLTKSSSGNCGQQVSVTYGYDAYAAGSNYGRGFRTSMTDASGSTAWTYDERGRVKSENKTIGANSFLTQWTYNSADLPVTMTYPDNETVTTTYNTRMLPASVAGTNTYAQSMTYDSAGRLTDLLLGNGLGQKFRYKAWTAQGGRLDALVSGTGTWNETARTFTTTLQKSTYSYDNVGNVTQIVNTVANETNAYGYDAINRLTSWTLNGQTETYNYNDSTGNLSNKAGLALNYPTNGTRPHAVTSAGSNTYGYDSNGNQTTRNISGNNYTLGYDAENHLVSVTGPSLTAQFTFDGDGRRVKSVVNGETILFAGGHYELKGSEVSKYYFAGASRIAVRKYTVPQTTTLTYLVGDHLGSTSLVTNASGALVAETRYKPWGEVRYTTSNQTLPTRYTFTGQYSHVNDDATDLGAAGFGLMFYNARWYDPQVGRFAQADTVVPGGVQGLDRYAYGLNNPSRYTDPSGHRACDEYDDKGNCIEWTANYVLSLYGITVRGATEDEKWAIYEAAYWTGRALVPYFGGSSIDAFRTVFGSITILAGTGRGPTNGNCETSNGSSGVVISCHSAPNLFNTIHEFGHAFDLRYQELSKSTGFRCDPCLASNFLSSDYWNAAGFNCPYRRPCMQHGPDEPGYNSSEAFADMFLNWVLDGTGVSLKVGFDDSDMGIGKSTWMNNRYYNPTNPTGIYIFLYLMGL